MSDFISVTCYKCSVTFGMERATHQELKRSSHTFHCPYGHPQHFLSKGEMDENEKLRLERDRLKQNVAYLEDRRQAETDRAEAAQRSARAYRGQVTKIKNRVGRGVCP